MPDSEQVQCVLAQPDKLMRILAYAETIGLTFVSREEAEKRRGMGSGKKDEGRIKNASFSSTRFFTPRFGSSIQAMAEGALLRQFRHLHTEIHGTFIKHLRNNGKYFDHEEKRERDLILIYYKHPEKNVYEVTREWAFHNGS